MSPACRAVRHKPATPPLSWGTSSFPTIVSSVLEVRNVRLSYPADHPLAGEFEEQATRLVREYKGGGEYLSVHHPAEADAKDDAPDATALAGMAAMQAFVGDLLFA